MRRRIRLRRKPLKSASASPDFEQREADLSSTFASPIEPTLLLQRTIGNKGVQALIESDAIHEQSGTALPSRRPRPELYAIPGYQVKTPVLRQNNS